MVERWAARPLRGGGKEWLTFSLDFRCTVTFWIHVDCCRGTVT